MSDVSARAEEVVGLPPAKSRVRAVAAWVTTGLACLVVLVVLVDPSGPAEFVQIPVEGLLGVALVLILPARARWGTSALVGVALGFLAILEIIDVGFIAVLDRPFDPVLDWTFLDSGVVFLKQSIGPSGAYGSVIAAVLVAVGVIVMVTVSVLRLSRLVVRHRTAATRGAASLGVVWLLCAALGVQLVPAVPVAAHTLYDRLAQVGAGLRDQSEFAAELAVDAYRDTPGRDLLGALRGKDVIVAYVESYGRVAAEDPEIDAVLDAGQRRLSAAGFASRSAYVTSPTAGGGSWLAHATLLSGLWVNNQQRYRDLVASDRLTLTGAFRRAGWRTVGVMPGNTLPWPEGAFFGYDQIYNAADLGYRGPNFSFATMPDQYALSAFERLERARPDHPPVMAEIPLISSHAPWAPVPSLINWGDVGDGSVFEKPSGAGDPAEIVWQRDADRVRGDYRKAIGYSLNTLVSYVETYGDDDLVLVFLGDHQPATVITGAGASRDAPITIVARDPAVMDRISGWGWRDGPNPGPPSPVWRMDSFRDRFLAAFGH